ncbi:MAG: hypothetical protein V1815_01580 [Candidatus Woesearchaeota archaeon]
MPGKKEDYKRGYIPEKIRGVKDFFVKGNYETTRLEAKAERSLGKLSLLANYIVSIANRIKRYEQKHSHGYLTNPQFRGLLNKEKEEVGKFKRQLKSLETVVADALAVILILGAIFLFSFSKDPITGYSIYTATSSLNYAVLSGVFLLLSSIFLIIKTHK